MALNRARTRSSTGMGLFTCGLSIIVAAALLNIAYDRLSGGRLEALPPFLVTMYDGFGKAGVTLVFVAAGLSMILVSFVVLRNREPQGTRHELAQFLPRRRPYFSPPPPDDASESGAPGGSVVLSTRKYL